MQPPAAKPPILIVDDDSLISEALGIVLARDFVVHRASTRREAVALVEQVGVPSIALVDLGLPPHPHAPTEGFALIGELLARDSAIRVLVLSGQSDDANARHARTLGAIDFVSKPVEVDVLRQLLLRLASLDTAGGTGLIGESPPLVRLRTQIKQFAQSPFPVLIEGESGSGKELAAAALHKLSPRAQEAYLALNCAALSPSLVEAMLFGHAKGSFTGATGARAGYFEDAANGTLFLDEIGELPLELQPKLLRVLENGEYQRIGETQPRYSSARIVAATNRDLRQEVRAGRFRADLYHRLSVFSVNMPALRDLGEDRMTLFRHFALFYARQANCAPVSLEPAARDRLDAYAFPGNVRELRNIAIRLTAKHPGQTVTAFDLEGELEVPVSPSTPMAEVVASPMLADDAVGRAMARLGQEPNFALNDELHRFESAYIEAAQRLAGGNLSQAARMLGISRTTLYNRIESLMRAKRQ